MSFAVAPPFGCASKDIFSVWDSLTFYASALSVAVEAFCFRLSLCYSYVKCGSSRVTWLKCFMRQTFLKMAGSQSQVLFCFSLYRCCSQERLLILTTSPPSTEPLSADGEKLDLSLTTLSAGPWVDAEIPVLSPCTPPLWPVRAVWLKTYKTDKR